MADKLRWFPFYAGDWMTDQDVLELSGEQMGAYLWLLCLQWQQGALPYEAHRVVAMSPRGIPEVAITYVLLKFFPPDPDTNERRNPKLAGIRERQLATYEVRVGLAAKARKARQSNAVSSHQSSDQVGDERETLSFSINSLSRSVLGEGGLGGELRKGLESHPDALAVLEGWVRSSQRPEAVIATVRAYAPGGTREAGSWADLAVGLVEAAATKGEMTPNKLAGFIRGGKRSSPSGQAAGLSDAFFADLK